MRKIISIVAVIFLIASLQSGCKDKNKQTGQTPVDPDLYTLNVLTTVLPIYALTLDVVKGSKGVEVDVFVPPDMGNPHDFEPSPSDMKKIEKADIMLANGLGLEGFIDKIKAVRPDLKIVYIADDIEPLPDSPQRIGFVSELATPEKGMEGKPKIPNPHVWTSPLLASNMVLKIAGALTDIDLKNADLYKANAEKYATTLVNLSDEFRKTLIFATNRKVITTHNAFDYLARDAGFQVVGVIRIDSRAEPSASDIAELVKIVKSQQVVAIFAEPQLPARIAELLSTETGAPLYELDPLETGKPSADLFVNVLLKNLEAIKQALAF